MSFGADLRPPAHETRYEPEPSPQGRPARVIPIREARPAPDPAALKRAVESACRRIPPLWTLRNFVAVNAFMGLGELPFAQATREAHRLFRGQALMPLTFYREEHRRGRIRREDLRRAAGEAASVLSRPDLAGPGPDRLLAELLDEGVAPRPDPTVVLTLAEAIDREDGSDWSRLAVEEISKWCAGRFDLGQAAWRQPWREQAPYPAWREAARRDRNPELRGLAGFRAYVASLPEEPLAAIAAILAQLEVPAPLHQDLLTRELASVAGWAGHVQWRVREASRTGERDDALVHLLAIRLAFDGALGRALAGRSRLLRGPVGDGAQPAAGPGGSGAPALDERERRVLWQLAYETTYRSGLLAELTASGRGGTSPSGARPRLQAVFCIDVRSEPLRRNLEAASPAIQTLGFAGFFGFPLEYVKAGAKRGSARCPVLIAPGPRVRERADRDPGAEDRARRARERHERFGALRKMSVGAYPLVETLGHFFGLRLVSDSLGWTRPREGGALFASRADRALSPSTAEEAGGWGLTLAERVDLAETALRNMGLTGDFAEVVLLCGHGSRSTNNPYASSLDCGACGGHRGDVNARVAAAVLDSPEVRAALAQRGIRIPADTRFVAGLHDTTRDTVRLLDADRLRPGLRRRIVEWLSEACERTREERARSLGEVAGPGLARRLRRRAGDWSEVRPEWGLAGNAAFIAAPRRRTRGLDLQGRVFLHDYDPEADPEGRVLELILTAPLVVASWINLQYYASTTDNEVFGSGNKALHNVVGRHGVLLGNRSDLRVGLPWQSVHDGRRFVHEPMRLTAIVEAPRERIDAVLGAHPALRQTLENGWLQLLAWDAAGGRFQRYVGGAAGWEAIADPR